MGVSLSIAVVCYLALFRLDELGMAHFRKFVASQDINRMYRVSWMYRMCWMYRVRCSMCWIYRVSPMIWPLYCLANNDINTCMCKNLKSWSLIQVVRCVWKTSWRMNLCFINIIMLSCCKTLQCVYASHRNYVKTCVRRL